MAQVTRGMVRQSIGGAGSALGRLGPRRMGNRWLMILGAIVLLAAAGIFLSRTMVATEQKAQAAQGPAAIAVKTSQIATGPIATNLSYTGDVKASSQVSLLPKATGRIEKLAVDVGSQVKKGDVIAELDSGAARAQVDQATANLAAAQAKLANMNAGTRPEQLAQAKANLASAQEKLAGMKEGGRDEQVAQAEAALKAAQAKADQVKKGPTDADMQAAQSGADAAQAGLKAAQARLDTVKQGPTQSDWGAALGAVDAARAAQRAAEARLADLQAGPKAADIAAAEAAVVQAKAQVAAADDLKDMVGTQSGLLAGATSGEKVNRQAAAAQAALDAAQAKLDLLRSTPLPADLQAAQSAVDTAKANVMATEYRVDQMKRGATAQDVQQAQSAVDSANSTLAAAQSRLKQAQDGPTQNDLDMVDAAVTQAENALALAKNPFGKHDVAQMQLGVQVAQQQLLLAQNPYTDNDMKLAQASVAQAQAALDLAQIGLGESQVVSPIDGVVSDKFQSLGALVNPAVPIVGIISPDVELVLGVEESQIGQVKEGQKAEISVAAYPGVVFPAKVSMVAPAADPKSRTFQVKIKPDDKEGKLKQGMFAQVKVVTQEKANAILVPKEAVVTRSGQTSVFVVNGDVVQQRPVKLGLAGNGTVEVLSGVNAGDEIVVAGQNDLRDGDKIKKS